jgi:hypothetical protein
MGGSFELLSVAGQPDSRGNDGSACETRGRPKLLSLIVRVHWPPSLSRASALSGAVCVMTVDADAVCGFLSGFASRGGLCRARWVVRLAGMLAQPASGLGMSMHVWFSVKWLALWARCHLPVSGPNVGRVRTALYAPVRKLRLTVGVETGCVAAAVGNIGGSRQRAAAVTTLASLW